MATLDELLERCRESSYVPLGGEPTLALDRRESVDEAVLGLARYFGEDAGRRAVLVTVDGEFAGYLERQQLYSFFAATEKGIGVSDPFGVLGDPGVTLFTLRCPRGDFELLTARLGSTPPRMCPSHPNLELEVVP
jgi:hypothetical protein